MRAFYRVLYSDVLLAWRQGSISLVVAFLFIALTLVPFGVGPELALLKRLGPGLLWVVIVLALLLSLDRLFQSDAEDGGFDQLMLSAQPLEILVLAKLIAHYISLIIPLSLVLPLAGFLVNIDIKALWPLILSVLVAGPALCALGAIGSALSVSVRRAGLLTALIVMPLYVPVLLFGANATQTALLGNGTIAFDAIAILAAMSVAAILLAPVAISAALRGLSE